MDFLSEPNIYHSCNYTSIEEFANLIKTKKEVFSALSLNIRSLKNKKRGLIDFFTQISTTNFRFSCVAFKETGING